jgi:hypothetical protein
MEMQVDKRHDIQQVSDTGDLPYIQNGEAHSWVWCERRFFIVEKREAQNPRRNFVVENLSRTKFQTTRGLLQ